MLILTIAEPSHKVRFPLAYSDVLVLLILEVTLRLAKDINTDCELAEPANAVTFPEPMQTCSYI